MHARAHGPVLLPTLLALVPACAPSRPAAPEAPPAAAVNQPGTGNQKPGTDLYGDPLPPGAIARMGTVRFHHGERIHVVAFSPDGKTLASGSLDNTIRLWELVTGKNLQKIDVHKGPGWVSSIAFSPDGKTLASGSEDGSVRLWEVATGKELLKLKGHKSEVHSVAFSPDGKTLASGGETIRLWDIAAKKELLIIKIDVRGRDVWSIAFSPDGKTLASGCLNSMFYLWESATGRKILEFDGHEEGIRSVAFSPDGKTLASGGDDKTIRLWDTTTGKELVKIDSHREKVLSVVFSLDATKLASGLANTTVLIWNRPLAPPSFPANPISQEAIESFWSNLAGDDTVRAYAAIGTLAHGDKGVVHFLKDQLKPPIPDENRPKRIQQLIADLDHDDIVIRDKANRELETMGPVVEQDLQKALETTTSSELKTRASHLLEPLTRLVLIPPGEPLRRWRAIQVLERIGSPEACEVLEMLEKESPSLRERREAKAALERLTRGAGFHPRPGE